MKKWILVLTRSTLNKKASAIRALDHADLNLIIGGCKCICISPQFGFPVEMGNTGDKPANYPIICASMCMTRGLQLLSCK